MTTTTEKKETKKTFADVARELGLNEEQIAFYQQMSKERSCYAYQKIAKEKGVGDTIDEDWKYCGYFDAGYRGADHCSLGHALRYVHIAENKHTGEIVKFGIKCASDFFHITPIQLKFIRAGFREANEQIEQSLNMYLRYNGDFDAYDKDHEIVKMMNMVLDYNANLLDYPYKDEFENMMLVAEMREMIDLRLPLPQNFEWKIRSAYRNIPYDVRHPKTPEEIAAEEARKAAEEAAAVAAKAAMPVTYVIDQEHDERWDEVNDYVYENHNGIFNTIVKIRQRIKTHSATAKQVDFVKRLIMMDYQKVDEMLKNVDEEKIAANYKRIYNDLKSNYEIYGLSEKQIGLLNKCIASAEQPATA